MNKKSMELTLLLLGILLIVLTIMIGGNTLSFNIANCQNTTQKNAKHTNQGPTCANTDSASSKDTAPDDGPDEENAAENVRKPNSNASATRNNSEEEGAETIHVSALNSASNAGDSHVSEGEQNPGAASSSDTLSANNAGD